ncbi:hypothetical protein NKDENANG_03963 [Candidatus Entotheonellaceae bacterium PAL068K]
MGQSRRPAPWWQAVDRRTFGKGALAFTMLAGMSGCEAESQVNTDSLDLQRQHGWNVGTESSRLFFVGLSERDYAGSTDWKRYTDATRLMDTWRPRTETWQPFFVPTLMQSLQATTLRQQMRPVSTRAMREAFQRGTTLREDLLSQVTKAGETLFIADLPGPEVVAFGAGMAGWADLIVNFENWPHPSGVVRSHETLGALLYYASYMQKQKQRLPAAAPGLLLLDNQRLAAYTEDSTQFDNRYLATVPGVAALQQRGIKHIMYIVPTRKQKTENDDLNDEFVEYKDANIQVVMFPLSDLQKVAEPVSTSPSAGGSTGTVHQTNYYYGGGFGSHLGFLMLYSFLAPRPTAYYYYPAEGRRIGFGQTTRPRMRPPTYQPRARPTRFSSTQVGGVRGVGRRKPSGFGRTTVRTSGGRVIGVGSRTARTSQPGRSGSRTSQPGRSGSRTSQPGRSGSFGRGGFQGGG